MHGFTLFNNEPETRTMRAGEVIFREGDASDGHMYAVIEGEVEITRGDRTLELVPAGGVFGEMALIDQQPRAATALARAACRLAVVGERRFMVLVSQNPRLSLEIMRILADRVRHNLRS